MLLNRFDFGFKLLIHLVHGFRPIESRVIVREVYLVIPNYLKLGASLEIYCEILLPTPLLYLFGKIVPFIVKIISEDLGGQAHVLKVITFGLHESCAVYFVVVFQVAVVLSLDADGLPIFVV